MDLGSQRRGTDMGPSAIRTAGLKEKLERLGHEVSDGGNVFSYEAETRRAGDERARYLGEIVRACETLAKRVEGALTKGSLPLVLGGDHSIALGTVAGVRAANGRVGILWVDAHGDLNTPETTPSGNVHGMPLAAITGRGDPRMTGIRGDPPLVEDVDVAIVGLRSLDRSERDRLAETDIHVATMRDIDERGMRRVMEDALEHVLAGTDHLHVSLDLDAVDPAWAPGIGTPVPGGLTYREAHLAMELVSDSGALGSMELVEVNPILDERNRTAELAVDLAQSALGKAIL